MYSLTCSYNLCFSTDLKEKLNDLFHICGYITEIHVNRACKGIAFIAFRQPHEARRAINIFNGYKLEKKNIVSIQCNSKTITFYSYLQLIGILMHYIFHSSKMPILLNSSNRQFEWQIRMLRLLMGFLKWVTLLLQHRNLPQLKKNNCLLSRLRIMKR